jgi:hypothetical protein
MAVVLEHPERIAVVVGGEIGALAVDGGAGTTVEVDDDEELCRRVGGDVLPECVEGRGAEARGLGNGDGSEVSLLAKLM